MVLYYEIKNQIFPLYKTKNISQLSIREQLRPSPLKNVSFIKKPLTSPINFSSQEFPRILLNSPAKMKSCPDITVDTILVQSVTADQILIWFWIHVVVVAQC